MIAAIVVAGLAAAIGLGLTFWAKSPKTGGEGPGGAGRGSGPGKKSEVGGRPVITVGVVKASLGSIPVQIEALGAVTPVATIKVTARISGMLDRIAFTEGQNVRKGQLLAIIDPRPFEIAVQQARSQLIRDQALLQTARQDLARYQTLRSQDSVSGQTLDTQTALVRQDEAIVSADQASVANALLNLSFTRIVSPVAGRVGLRQIDAGNQISANQATPIAIVTQVDPITVVFSIPENDLPLVHVKNGGRGLPITLFDRAGGTALAMGSLETIDNQIDTSTGTVKAKAVVPNPSGALFANQFVNVRLLADTLRNQVIVPTAATRHGPQGDYVWILRSDRTVKARPVKLGPGTPETVSILTGLGAGETVITDGGDRLREGSKVVMAGVGNAAGAGGLGLSPNRGHRTHDRAQPATP